MNTHPYIYNFIIFFLRVCRFLFSDFKCAISIRLKLTEVFEQESDLYIPYIMTMSKLHEDHFGHIY